MFSSKVDNLQVAHELLLTMKQARFNLMYREVGSILNDFEFEDMHTDSTEYLTKNFSDEVITTFKEALVLMIPERDDHCAQYGFLWRYGTDGAKNVALFYDIVDYDEEEDAKDYN